MLNFLEKCISHYYQAQPNAFLVVPILLPNIPKHQNQIDREYGITNENESINFEQNNMVEEEKEESEKESAGKEEIDKDSIDKFFAF